MDEQFMRNRITELRMKKGVSERRMSEELGKNPGYIHQIVSGKMNPSLTPLLEICEYFGITIVDFFDENIMYPIQIREVIQNLLLLDEESIDQLNSLAKYMVKKASTKLLPL